MERHNKPEKRRFDVPLEISSTAFDRTPDTCEEMVNTYGTYNIQATADTDNEFPAIAQGHLPKVEQKDLKFHRSATDPHPYTEIDGNVKVDR